MKKIFSILLIFTVSISFSQERKIKSSVKSATVFLNSAQVTRTKKVQLNRGIQFLKFTDLSPFVDKKSIQIKAIDVEIQSVNFQKDYLSKKKKSPEFLKHEDSLKLVAKQLQNEQVNLSAINEDIDFLKQNRSIGNTSQKLTVNDLQQVSKYYSTQMKSLLVKKKRTSDNISILESKRVALLKQMKDLNSKKEFAKGEIVVKVKSPSTRTTSFEITYNVSNVGWYPSYDVRVKDINSPLSLVYKANLKQNSQVDWNNVKLRFSSANPSKSTNAGKIKPYFLNYGTVPPYYGNTINEVSGTVTDDETGEGLPGASIIVKGTSLGTSSDFNGNYSIKIPENANTLTFQYLGYKTETRRIGNSVINVALTEDANMLEEVAITGFGRSNNKRKRADKVLKGATPGINVGTNYNASIPTKNIINQTSVSFEVVEPYTVKSSNKDFVVSLKTYQSDAIYNYYAIPKIEESAFLVASLYDWEKFNLLEGEANIYFEDTFVGTTLIDTRYTESKLELSLGTDKNVTVNRKKAKDFTTRQFIGNKQEEARVWDFTIKNNKSQPIKMTVLDQIPVSTREEIKVTLDKLFDGELNKITGEVTWDFTLAPKQTKELKLKYSVRYPKNRNLVID